MQQPHKDAEIKAIRILLFAMDIGIKPNDIRQDTLAANPSIPSTQLIAFVIPTIQMILNIMLIESGIFKIG